MDRNTRLAATTQLTGLVAEVAVALTLLSFARMQEAVHGANE